MKKTTRLLALVLALLLPWTALAEGISTPTDSTPTAAPATEAPATEAPSEEPTEAPSEEPTEEPTETPSEEPTEEPTEAPSEEPAEEPTEAPSEEPTATPEAEATPEPWDESLCDHANVNCAQAPACDVPGCEHLGVDAHGLPVPLCAKGRWVLDQEDALARAQLGGSGRMLRARAAATVINLDTADAVIYRSGSYVVTGGSQRSGATLTIADERLVVLEMRGVTADVVTLGDKVGATISTVGQNRVNSWTLGQSSTTKLTSGGALDIGQVLRRAEGDRSQISVTGGSVNAVMTEAEGRTMVAFQAEGMTGATVDGAAVAVDRADADGNCYLWLPAPKEGATWQGKLEGGILAVSQVTTPPVNEEKAIIPGEVNRLEEGGVYTLKGEIALGTQLQVAAAGVNIVLDTATGELTLPLIEAEVNCTVTLKGETSLTGVALAEGTGTVLLGGNGTAQLAAIETPVTFACGTVVLDGVPAGYTAVEVPAVLASQALTIDGAAATLVRTSAGALVLPQAAEGTRWTVVADESTVTVRSESLASAHYSLAENPQVTSGEKSFVVDGTGSYVTGSVAATGASASATFRQVLVDGEGPVLTVSGRLSVALEGDNGLVSSGDAAIALKEGASLTLNAATGRLLIRHQANLSGITLLGNVKVEPEPDAPHTKIIIRDQSGNPVPNKALTLTVNGQSYQYTTHYDGSLHLWGLGALDATDLAATDGERVYTAVVMGGAAEATERLAIDGITVEDLADGSMKVSFTAEDAGTAGVMFYVGDEAANLPDTYAPEAAIALASGSEVILTGIPAGKAVSLRVFAAKAQGASLTAETADGFSFSDLVTVKHRGPFTVGDVEVNQTYTGKAYKNPITLPRGAKIAYLGERLNSDGMPVRVGQYTMKITVPENNDTYLPGVYEIPFSITKVRLTIIPEPNQEKLAGQEDPENFLYTVEGLLGNDQVDGWLTREAGEEPGNYAFLVDELMAADYYSIRLASDAYTFTIIPAEDGFSWGGGGGGVVLRPVRQTIVRQDKREVAVVLNTQDSLAVTYSNFGRVVFSTEDQLMRPFMPSLSRNESTDEVLLRIRTEAELNKDGGYVTDADGNPVWTGRYLRMGWAGIRQLYDVGVDAISLNCHGAALTVRLEELLSEDMQEQIRAQGGSLRDAYFRLTVAPVETSADAAEQAVLDALHPVTRAWQLSASLTVGSQETDITAMLPSLRASVDMQETAEMLQAMERYDEEAFPQQFLLYGVTAAEDSYASAAMESAFVQPWMPEELETVDFPAIMYTHDYLVAPMTMPTLVTVAQAPEAPDTPQAN